MTLAEILEALHVAEDLAPRVQGGVIRALGQLEDGKRIHVLGVVEDTTVGVEHAIELARHVLDVTQSAGMAPILMLVDCGSQRMSKHDELLGLNEYLAHLFKVLVFAEWSGHRTIGLLYGHAAAGAFIATGLATQVLVALPSARPEVMDLPSMSRVTKLPLDVLQSKSRSTAVFAPGLDNLLQAGAVSTKLDPGRPLAPQLTALLESRTTGDGRDRLGLSRKGRTKAAEIADRVEQLAVHHEGSD